MSQQPESAKDSEKKWKEGADLFDILEFEMPELIRPCWFPECQEREGQVEEDSDSDTSDDDDDEDEGGDDERPPPPPLFLSSKFGGTSPWLDGGVGWPLCKHCSNAKSFLCQFRIDELPEEMEKLTSRKDGLFQCFACLRCRATDDDEFYYQLDGFLRETLDDARFVSGKEVAEKTTLKGLCAQTIVQTLEAQRAKKNKKGESALMQKLPDSLREYVERFDPRRITAKLKEREEEDGPPAAKKRRESSYHRTKFFTEKLVESWSGGTSELPDCFEIGGHRDEILRRVPEARAALDRRYYNYEWESIALEVKLGGYFFWMPGHSAGCQVCYPKCKDCPAAAKAADKDSGDDVDPSPEMDLAFLTLRKGDILNYEWGEDGMGFVAICPQCKRPELCLATI